MVGTSRIRDLLRMNHSNLTSSSVTEDPQMFIKKMKRVYNVMHVVKVEIVELDAYQMKGVSTIWYDQWKKNRVEDVLVVS